MEGRDWYFDKRFHRTLILVWKKNILNPGQSNLSIVIYTKASGVAEKEEEQILEKLVAY